MDKNETKVIIYIILETKKNSIKWSKTYGSCFKSCFLNSFDSF